MYLSSLEQTVKLVFFIANVFGFTHLKLVYLGKMLTPFVVNDFGCCLEWSGLSSSTSASSLFVWRDGTDFCELTLQPSTLLYWFIVPRSFSSEFFVIV